ERYDPQTRTWRAGPSLPIALHHATAVTYHGEVVIIGGATGNTVYCIDGANRPTHQGPIATVEALDFR
ncbi:hypothetical protein, partial [Mycobacterium haemophilum]